jgi:hypothetical protein
MRMKYPIEEEDEDLPPPTMRSPLSTLPPHCERAVLVTLAESAVNDVDSEPATERFVRSA